MKITSISAQQKSQDRVNISVDGKYRFSLDISQVVDLGIKVGNDYTKEELIALESESQFGKLYIKALEYCLIRPRSQREVRDYLWRSTRTTKYKSRSGDIKERSGVSQEVADRVFNRLVEKRYVNDEDFAGWWVENRNLKKGVSRRKITAELRSKGVDGDIIESKLDQSARTDLSELRKVIAKRRRRYDDQQKFIQYLARLGFSYDDIKSALSEDN